MVTVISEIKNYMFSSDLTEFSFRTTLDAIHVRIDVGEHTVFDEVMIPNAAGIITLRDVYQLIEPYLIENLVADCEYVLTAGEVLWLKKKFKVQYCKSEIGTDAETFINDYFLTTLIGDKVTALSKKEYLHLVCSEPTQMKVAAIYKIEGGREEVVKDLELINTLNAVYTVDVSASLLKEQGKDLLAYTIVAGSRRQTYLLDRRGLQSQPDLLFTNSFGCQETFYCRGTFRLEGEMERQQAYIDGKFKTFHVNESRKYKANTGMLTSDMANWAEDLFRATEIYLFDGETGAIGKEITITESKFLRSSDPDELPSFNFEYRYSQRNQNILHVAKAGRIFDSTFDKSFN